MNLIYVLKKIWFLVALLLISVVFRAGGPADNPLYPLFDAYWRFALYVIITGTAARLLPRVLPEEYDIHIGFFSCHAWEKNGKIYDRLFRVTKWKDRVMEADRIFGKSSGDSRNSMRDPAMVKKLLNGTCISELVHWVLILLSPLLLMIIKNRLRWLFWGLYLADNLKDIIIQRYNRPRLVRLSMAANLRRRKGEEPGSETEKRSSISEGTDFKL